MPSQSVTDARILVVDDEPDIRDLVREILDEEGFDVSVAEDGDSARSQYQEGQPDLVLLDIWMPDVDGISLLQEWHSQDGHRCPVVMMSGHGTIETAVEATRSGAFDFIEKPLSMGKLLLTVKRALEAGRRHAGKAPRAAPQEAREPMGNSAAMTALRSKAARAAASDAPVLLLGEAGSGKETLARYIHSLGKHAAEPFIKVDLSTLDQAHMGHSLAELAGRVGRGSLYLADIGNLGEPLQAWFNALLESGHYPDPEDGRQRPFAGRLLVACSQAPDSLVKSGRLLEALYYRINVLPLEVPPLRTRLEDVPELLRFFSEQFPSSEGLPYRHFSVSAQNRLRNHNWPGNVRELENLVRRLLVLGENDEISGFEVEQAIAQGETALVPLATSHPDTFNLPLREAREQFEREYLTYQLKKAGGSVGKLSTAVGMERTHLYRKLRALGIDPKRVGRG